MTIQVAVANAYGAAMASDRHVYRAGQALSTGRQAKLAPLRGPVAAAMMTAGSFALLGIPLARLALRVERALAEAAEAGPDGLAEAALGAIERPLELKGGAEEIARRDAEALARAADLVLSRAREAGGLEAVLEQIARAPLCRGGEEMAALGRAAWQDGAAKLAGLAEKPELAEALRETPDLLGEAVVSALARDWGRRAPDASVMVGVCCPESGVPAVVAVNLWKGLGGRLIVAPRHDRPHYAMHHAGRSLLLAQGSGRPNVATMIEGVAESVLAEDARGEAAGAAVDRRWRRAHDRISVSSPAELVSIATGLVRGAEVIGYLTGEDEGTVGEVDAVLLTPRGVATHTLPAAPEALEQVCG